MIIAFGTEIPGYFLTSPPCWVVTNHFGNFSSVKLLLLHLIAVTEANKNHRYIKWKKYHICFFRPRLNVSDLCCLPHCYCIICTWMGIQRLQLKGSLNNRVICALFLISPGTMEELHSLDPRRQELLEARFMGGVSGSTGGSTGSTSGGTKVSVLGVFFSCVISMFV